ncbi:hypothetical protein [Corynebacterium sp.]|uniref:hypothetical protein n=1 Tax=Corynebacterium sp. TaxID=1720 RepID=UPI0025C0AE75|nr:hypothetical protein [Corynebacterium sp.]
MRRDLTDTEQYLKSLTDHPAGRYLVGRHRSEPELTPLQIMQQQSWFRRLEAVLGALGVIACMLVALLVLRVLFLVVMSLW